MPLEIIRSDIFYTIFHMNVVNEALENIIDINDDVHNKIGGGAVITEESNV